MYLIVGLGNPGKQYQNTRHNLGFAFVDRLVKKLDSGARFTPHPKLKSEIIKTRIDKELIIIVKPQTYMNLSGEATKAVIKYFKAEIEDVIIVSDDTNLDVGQARIRFGGEAGGHNGLKSVIAAVGEDFWRVRLGIGIPDLKIAMEDYVLAKIPENDQKIIKQVVDKTAGELIKSIVRNKIENRTIN